MVTNKKVFITGGSGGIGSAICEKFINDNYSLVLTSSSLRHLYFAEKLNSSPNLNICKIILEGDLPRNYEYDHNQYDNFIEKHFASRHNSEVDFFSDSVKLLKEKSKIINIKKNEINNPSMVKLKN